MRSIRLQSVSLAVLAALALGGLGLWGQQSAAADASPPAAAGKPALTVTLTQARVGSLPIKLAANGSMAAWQEAIVGAEANGLRVQELMAGVGDAVQRGQVLATFAPESVQADVALARASLAEAQANALDASANAERARAVQGSGALSAQQVNQYLTQELTARARVESAKAQLDTQLLRLKHTQVLAPDAGIVSARSATVGAVLGAGVEMFRLIRQGRLEWRAELTSAELGRVSVGTGVLVTAPGGAQLKGRVRMVAPTVDAQSRNGLVYVDLPPMPAGAKAGAFKPGMFARGEFELGQSSALTVVQSAVLVREGFSFVMRVGADQRVTQLKVQTGRVLGDQVEILSGIKPDDRLVASGASFLSDGDLVRVVDAAAPISKEKSTAAQVLPAPAASK
ncbi:MAG: efflux RND transporter periplasmic adaptor subunit [Rhodoferax sp.]|uniref:efflux RND transporter periplasmic adaptor subunit n=1 Tax=Rhodoferax sp. TaxID=50421 RepID=UPI001B793496|nr:efflux RND transporter periplasmic adaptor subunit [Rhodoferax sp.]MBP9906054.1 efflux RND transporter periplasmic adaptor subunit [Rhodoferax sp.]